MAEITHMDNGGPPMEFELESPNYFAAAATPDTSGDQGKIPFLEFFAGSGLVAQGMRDSFRPVWANDICAKKAIVYHANHGSGHFKLGSITDIKGRQLPATPMAWASFPCQDLSLAGLTGGIHASRSGLVWEWLRVMDEMRQRPPVLVAENVAGLVSSANGAHYRALHEALRERGYQVGAVLMDARHWAPQSRPRVFVIAIDKEVGIPAGLVDSRPNWLHTSAIRKVAEGLSDWVWWNMPEPASPLLSLEEVIEWDAPFHDPVTEARTLALIAPKHRERLDAMGDDVRFVAPGYKRTRNGKQVLELRFDGLSGCLRTPEGGSSRQVIVIKQNGLLRSRLLTVREAARLMGAPDTYRIPGSYNDGYKAMGDAVAAPVAGWLAQHLLKPLVEATSRG